MGTDRSLIIKYSGIFENAKLSLTLLLDGLDKETVNLYTEKLQEEFENFVALFFDTFYF